MSAILLDLQAYRLNLAQSQPQLHRLYLQYKLHLVQAELETLNGYVSPARYHRDQAERYLTEYESGIAALIPATPDTRVTETVTSRWLRALSPARQASALVPSCGTSEGGDAA